jgi:hypothetical protein
MLGIAISIITIEIAFLMPSRMDEQASCDREIRASSK